MRLIYNLAIYLYLGFIKLASVFNSKARRWNNGRKGLFEKLKDTFKGKQQIAWFHCASLGEFEQGRPLIEAFKKEKPEYKILLTFFSPSGYEVRKNYQYADFVFYLPMDTPSNAKQFIEIVQPDLAFFIKYEFWFNYLSRLREKKIPTYLISAIFRKDQHFFKWYGGFFRKGLNTYEKIFVQDEDSKDLLQKTGLKNVLVSGDTRFDRVFQNSKSHSVLPLIENFKGGNKLLVCGSTWPVDEQLLCEVLQNFPGLKVIIAPHEVEDDHIKAIENLFPKATRFSKNEVDPDKKIMIIDNVGKLSTIYQYSDIVYIGGGFGKGIHNILEASVFGIPVIFGPKYKKFKEAVELVEKKGAFSVNSVKDLSQKLKELFNDKNKYDQAAAISKTYVIANTGATGIILSNLKVK